MPSEILECCLGIAPEKYLTDDSSPVSPVFTSNANAQVPISMKPPLRKPEKEFVPRESLLTEIFNTENGSAVYRMCMILSSLTFISSSAVDVINHQTLNIGQLVLWKNIQGVPLSLLCWLAMLMMVLSFYCGFRLWAIRRKSSKVPILWDLVFFVLLVACTALFLIMPAACILLLSLAPVCSFGLLMEQVRFFTKTYAFLRVKIVHVKDGGDVPEFNHFLLFLVVPTLIYKDEYPRSPKVRWRIVAQHILELVWSGVMISYCLARVHAPPVLNFRSFWLDGKSAISNFIATLVPTTFILLVGFFGYFHSFCNLLAEITGFQDRMFYKDWWNATSFKTFFTSWNTLVQDWLYYYIFADVRKITGSPIVAAGTVFLISGIVHEYVLSFFFQFFYPVLVVVFVGAGLILKSIPTARVSPAFGNVTLWICIPIGSTIIITCYMTEFLARTNCPYGTHTSPWVDFFIPRSWSCPLTE